jgi:hypothetical protein
MKQEYSAKQWPFLHCTSFIHFCQNNNATLLFHACVLIQHYGSLKAADETMTKDSSDMSVNKDNSQDLGGQSQIRYM